MKKAIVSVTSDLCTDQRVHRTALALQKSGYSVLLIGRKKKESRALEPRPYETKRMNLWFEKKVFFYAEYSIRLFFLLIKNKSDLFFANDLDTLLPNFLVSKVRKQKLMYDTHEYFTAVPELIHRPLVRSIWLRIEKWIFPKLNTIITVSDSIANKYEELYGKKVLVIRNIPLATEIGKLKSRTDLGIPEGKKIILYQGAGINIDRGLEEAIEAMQYVENAVLLIVGGGDILIPLKEKVKHSGLAERILFAGKFSPEELKTITPLADIGLSLDKGSNSNYRFSLPNKLFDYIHAGVPVLASEVDEVKKLVSQFNTGTFIRNHDPKHIADKMIGMLGDEVQLRKWKLNCQYAAKELSWDKEEKLLIHAIQNSK